MIKLTAREKYPKICPACLRFIMHHEGDKHELHCNGCQHREMCEHKKST